MKSIRFSYVVLFFVVFTLSCSSGSSTGNPMGDHDSTDSTDLSEREISPESEEETTRGLLAASPEEVRFGAVVLGVTAKETLTLINDGEENLTISVVRTSEATTSEFSVQAILDGDQTVEVPFVLVPDQRLAVTLQYVPVDAGSDTGTLQIIGEGFQGNLLEIPLFAVEKGESALDVSPRLEFGYVRNIGEEETQALTIWNLPDDPDTNRTLQITKLEVTEGTRDFHLDLDSCAASSQHPILIAPGHNHSCTVAFSPREAGELFGSVRVETNASEGETSRDIDLTGRCAPPESVLTLVVDPRGEPVPGAALRLWGENTVISTTDNRGRAVILPEEGGQIFAADGATSIKGVYSRQYKQVLPADEVTVFVLETLPVETSQPVSQKQLSAANLEGARLEFSTDDVLLPNGSDTTFFMGEGHISAAPYDLPEGKELVQMFHFGPDGTTFSTPAKLTLPNSLELTPGERIEFHSFDESTLLWEKAAVLEVSPDGKMLETVEGGISHFSVGGIFQPDGSLPEYTVTGLVQDDLEQNLSNIHVFALGKRGRMLEDDTNSEGRYTISGVRVACYHSPYLTVAASHSGDFLDDTLTSVIAEVSDDPSQTVQAPVLILPNNVAKGSVRGVALSPLGTPVENTLVTVHPSLGWNLYARTDSLGSFVISAVPVGATRVEITHDELELYKEISGTIPENGEWNLGLVILDEVTDTTSPSMLWSMPLDGQGNLHDLRELRVAFSETLNAATLQATLKKSLTDETVSGVATLENGTAVVFTPEGGFEDGRAYTFILSSGLADLSGNALGEDFVLQFQTVAPNCPDEECKSGIYVWTTETCGFNDVEEGTSCRNDHGSCNQSGECVCNNAFMMEDCSACRDGYIDFPNCRDNPCEPDPCNDHGMCNSEDGSCTCDNEFMTADCGTCQDDYEGYPNCERPCIPKTCEDLGYECGTWPDGCGDTVPCGGCESGFTCHETFGQCNIDCPGGVTARRIDEAYYPGATQTVYVADGYVYANRGRILDIYTDAGVQLQKVNEIHMPWEIKDIFVVDGWAYVALGAKGLAILDISDPSDLGQPVYSNTTGEALRVFVSGNYAYVADNESGLAIIDVSDPSVPGEPAYVETNGDVMDVFISGNYAFLANEDSSVSDSLHFAVVDVSDPLNPGEPVYNETGGVGYYSGIFVSGNYAYRTIGTTGLAIIDIRDPLNPGDPVRVDTDDSPLSVIVHGNTAYVSDRNSGVAVIDVTDPTEPGEPVYWESIDYAADIAISGSTAYVATGNTGLAAVNIAVPSNPGQPVFMDTYGNVPRVFVAHDVAFLAGGTSGLVTVDVTNPAEPGVPVYTDTTGSANSVFVAGYYAYVADNTSGLAIFDIADPTHPQTPEYLATEQYLSDVFISNDLAYVVGSDVFHNGLAVIDVSDPLNPGILSSSTMMMMQGYSDVFIYGNLAYVLNSFGSLVQLDISDPTNPSTFESPVSVGWSNDTFVYENHIYAAQYEYINQNSGIATVDITDVDNPGEPVHRDTNEKPYGIFVSGKEAYVANGLSGLSIINVSEPSNPGEPAYFETTGSANEIFVSGNHAWIAEDTNGMETFELRCIGTCDPDPCNGHGICAIEDGDVACTCYEGFDGDWCDQCAEGYDGYPDCEAVQTAPGFVPIEAGTFWMGSPDGDCPEGYPGECTEELGRVWDREELHEVTLTYDFEMQAHEVTQKEWTALMIWNPSYFSADGGGVACGDDCPVEKVSWFDVLAYANELSINEGLVPCYELLEVVCELGLMVDEAIDCFNAESGGIDSAAVILANGTSKPQNCEGFRLPTEAEWEYAIRSGSEYTAFHQSDGNDGTIMHTGIDPVDPNLDQIGWFGGNANIITHPVGEKEMNTWGLYDMSGNVVEWIWDWYRSDYETDVGTDPVGPSTGGVRISHGGRWNYMALGCRSAYRAYDSPGDRRYDMGFRLVRTLHPDSCDPDPCNNHGSCDDTSDYALCDCNTGYDGGDCSVCAEGYIGYPDCIPEAVDGDEEEAEAEEEQVACQNDEYEGEEGNETFQTAISVTEGTIDNLILCPEENDYYYLDLSQGEYVTIELLFIHSQGDINLVVFRDDFSVLVAGATTNDNEFVQFSALYTATYYIKVSSSDDEVENDYSLAIQIESSADGDLDEETETEEDVEFDTTPGFVSITAGTFWMGSPDGSCPDGYLGNCISESGRTANREELHEVTLTYNFEMMQYEVTQEEWQTAFGNNPSYHGPNRNGPDCGLNCPIEMVNWYDVLAYANWYSSQANLQPCYLLSDCTGTLGGGCDYSQLGCAIDTYQCTVALNGVDVPQQCEGYRLPTDAEWEYAIRAGNQYTAFYQSEGNNGTITWAGCNNDPNMLQIGWYCDNSSGMPHPVGTKDPNAWNLYDMSGNVWEWVWDRSCDNIETFSLIDPDANECSSADRIRRSGYWGAMASECRSAFRASAPPTTCNREGGFRLVRTIF